MRIFLSRQFGAFLISGGIAAAVNFFSRILYDRWLGYSGAIFLAYLTGMVTAYVLAHFFVFRGGGHPLGRSVLLFTLVNVVAVLQTWAVSLLLARQVLPAMGVHAYTPEIAHAVGVMVPVFTSYLGHKYLTFRAADTA
jgi:putative flippase GtrA